MPSRIQRSRARGWRLPSGAIYVGRPTKWGNPYRIKDYGGGPVVLGPPRQTGHHLEHDRSLAAARGLAADLFCQWLVDRLARNLPAMPIAELRGKDLCCWCPLDQPCHADVLLELANG